MSTISLLRTVQLLIILYCSIGFLWLGVSTHWRFDLKANLIGTLRKEKVLIYTATGFFGAAITDLDLERCSAEVRDYCSISSNVEDLKNADAVVFHSRNFDEMKMINFTEEYTRNPDIPYVMMALECPFYAELHEYRGFFNWTMTYRLDSDVHLPYGRMVRRSQNAVPVDYEGIWNSKAKTALWLVSNKYATGNRRKELVEKMVKEGLEVDLRGALYQIPLGCSRQRIREDCEIELHRPYKFTIAFENNNCKDYVTEKFWYKMLKFQMVPIVMTRKIYRDLGIPDSMFIAVDDFGSLKDLIAHIDNVSANKTAYLEYHKWREDFEIVDWNEGDFGFCQLCRKVADFRGTPRKSYESLKKWFNTSDCDNTFANSRL